MSSSGAPASADPATVLAGRDLTAIFRLWEEKYLSSGYDPTPVVKRLAELFEDATTDYYKGRPDPFDERHPSRADPNCDLGKMLKFLFKKDNFITRLVSDYLRPNYFTRQNMGESSLELNTASCRLILVIMPGLETTAVFNPESDQLINRIYNWAEDSIEPLQSYATGLLGAAMEVSEIAVTFRELNLRLVPKMLKRLQMLQEVYKNRDKDSLAVNKYDNRNSDETSLFPSWMGGSAPSTPTRSDENIANNKTSTGVNNGSVSAGGTTSGEGAIGETGNLSKFPSSSNLTIFTENNREELPPKEVKRYSIPIYPANIEFKKYMIPIYPATIETRQMFILRYLTSMGEYQEFLGFIFEHNAIQLIFDYIKNLDPLDTCLAFEALKYLSSLLCHKKFALEFITNGGIELLLQIPRFSTAATGVAVAYYYLAYCEDAMERICAMSKKIVSALVSYSIALLKSSHDSAKCHAIMFFGMSFQFKVMLDEFDNQEGLKKLYKVISSLPILSIYEEDDSEEAEATALQTIRHVCLALKKYMESHLFFKYYYHTRQQCPSGDAVQPIMKAMKSTLEQVGDQIRYLQENTPVRMYWAPVDEFLNLGGVTLLLRVVPYSYEWTHNGRAETVRSALDVLSVCCVIPKTFTALCDRMELPNQNFAAGINAILGAAIGEIVADAEVQKSALALLTHTLCAPLSRPSAVSRFGSSTKKKTGSRHVEELVEKVWESACSNNGIIVLLQLIQVKTPITDADCIRGMACRALAGLARSERVRQIIGKLPLFTNGLIQNLMRDPILQEKRVEHVAFQKHALELLERVSGKSKPGMKQLDASLANIHKANVVAQTIIQYNEQQLLELIHDHLISKGMQDSAAILQKEAGLNAAAQQTHTKLHHHSPFNFNKNVQMISLPRARIRTKAQDLHSFNHHVNDSSVVTGGVQVAYNDNEFSSNNRNIECIDDPMNSTNFNTPIKLIKKSNTMTNLCSTNVIHMPTQSNSSTNQTHRSLQKQTSSTELPSFVSGPSNSAAIENYNSSKSITLNTIVTEYLKNQHALCNNPMTTCPQFDLFVPHKCPDPKPNRTSLDFNLTARVFKAQSGHNTMRLDRRFVHTQFSPSKTIRPQDYTELQFTCCDFLPCNSQIVVGTYHGEAKIYNIADGNEEFSGSCHGSFVESVKCNRDGTLLLTSCSWRSPLSVLWSIKDKEFVSKISFNDDFYCEFSNLRQDRILGTKLETASIYDLHTGSILSVLKPTISNQYTKNRATYCPTDELILSDGVLWDVRMQREIHKFDKLNQTLSGVFHPNGLEILSNTEVWDIRTFHLLQTVPVLDQCLIKFSPLNVIYGINFDTDNNTEFEEANNYGTSFKVLDSFDYSSISTIDVKRNIFDLSINSWGSYIALVENQSSYDTVQESLIRIYAAGVRKSDEDEEDEEELQTEENSGSDSDSSQNPDIPLFRINDNVFRRNRRRRNRRNAANGNGNNENDSDDNEWYDVDTSSSDDNDDDDDDNNDGDSDDSNLAGNGADDNELMVEFIL